MTTDIKPGTTGTCTYCDEKITWKHNTTQPLWVDLDGHITCDVEDGGLLHIDSAPEHLTLQVGP